MRRLASSLLRPLFDWASLSSFGPPGCMKDAHAQPAPAALPGQVVGGQRLYKKTQQQMASTSSLCTLLFQMIKINRGSTVIPLPVRVGAHRIFDGGFASMSSHWQQEGGGGGGRRGPRRGRIAFFFW